eukprot:gene16643-biopygen2893
MSFPIRRGRLAPSTLSWQGVAAEFTQGSSRVHSGFQQGSLDKGKGEGEGEGEGEGKGEGEGQGKQFNCKCALR